MAQPAALREYQAQRRREAIARVEAYRAWCKAGGDVRTMPEVPRDADFKLARSAGR